MSSPAALATVTATLHHLLSNVASGATVTTQSPSTARVGISDPQINIFLYGVHYNPAFRNSPMPGDVKRGEKGFSPMPLVLKYLITAYGEAGDDITGQELLGQAMGLLHDHPLLGKADIEGITPDSDLQNQIEKVRITPDMLSLDDMSKLWTSFPSAEYSLSTGYEVSVILIESKRDSSAPLPVLKRGEEDRGATVTAAPAATLSGLRFTNQKPSSELGDIVTLLGENLSHINTQVRLEHTFLDDAILVQPNETSDTTEMPVQIPGLAGDAEVGSKWPAGFYNLTLLSQQADVPAVVSNSISLALSPNIESIDPITAPAGNIVLTIECLPQIKDGQKVELLFSDRKIAPNTVTTPADLTGRTTLSFTVNNALAKATPYVIRLRVDGVDSIPVDFSSGIPEFADNQKVTVHD